MIGFPFQTQDFSVFDDLTIFLQVLAQQRIEQQRQAAQANSEAIFILLSVINDLFLI